MFLLFTNHFHPKNSVHTCLNILILEFYLPLMGIHVLLLYIIQSINIRKYHVIANYDGNPSQLPPSSYLYLFCNEINSSCSLLYCSSNCSCSIAVSIVPIAQANPCLNPSAFAEVIWSFLFPIKALCLSFRLSNAECNAFIFSKITGYNTVYMLCA